jgi:uncharacterized membrane protein YccF (DUF307 family)
MGRGVVSTQPVVVQSGGPNILIRALWFIFLGWWLGGIISAVAWFLVVIVIGLPLGLWLINRLPTVITLRAQEQKWRLDGDGVLRRGEQQRPLLFRAIYFLLVGWWLSGLWMLLAYGFLIIIVGIPLSFWMYGRIGAVTTLYRS